MRRGTTGGEYPIRHCGRAAQSELGRGESLVADIIPVLYRRLLASAEFWQSLWTVSSCKAIVDYYATDELNEQGQ